MTPRIFAPAIRLILTLLLLVSIGSSAHAQPAIRILFAESPALLIQLDGDPEYRGIGGTDLERIVNTRALIVRDSADIHYLKVLDGWMEAYGLTGNWSVSGVSPFGESTALERAIEAKTADLLGVLEKSRSLEAEPPTILISSEPAALIVTDGPARFQTIEGTSLERLVNTRATVFREPTDQELYVLVTGRWFSAWTTDGPWEFVPTDQLPADIVKQIALTQPEPRIKR